MRIERSETEDGVRTLPISQAQYIESILEHKEWWIAIQ